MYDVVWEEEKACFKGIAQALAAWYAHPPPLPLGLEGEAAEAHRLHPKSLHVWVSKVLFPGIKAGLLPPKSLVTDHHALQVAAAERLYSVFERC